MVPTNICPICLSESKWLFKTQVLKKYAVSYFECTACEGIHTEKPFWLGEAYGMAISSLDVGLVARNLAFSEMIGKLIIKYFNSAGKFLDYEGGYGLFVRMMRDRGFDFSRYDQYCQNIFAENFNVAGFDQSAKSEIFTAFEVFEHLPDPIAEVRKMLEYTDTVLFSTVLIRQKISCAEDRWYFVPETGQHIVFYTSNSAISRGSVAMSNLFQRERSSLADSP